MYIMKTKSPKKLGSLQRKIKKGYLYRKIRELTLYIIYFLSKNKPAKLKFIVFTQGRTGSELLSSLLNQHEHIYMDGESLYYKVMSPNLYIKAQMNIYANKAYGFKVKIEQLEDTQGINDPHEYIMNLFKDGWKVIYLKRNDLLRQALSNLVATKRKRWHFEKEQSYRWDKVKIDPDVLIERMKKLSSDTDKECSILNDMPHLKIVYEDDLFDTVAQQETLNKIFQYLEVEPIKVLATLARTSTNKLEDTIENYTEIYEKVKNSDFSIYL